MYPLLEEKSVPNILRSSRTTEPIFLSFQKVVLPSPQLLSRCILYHFCYSLKRKENKTNKKLELFTASCRLGVLVLFLPPKDIQLSASTPYRLQQKSAQVCTHVRMQRNITSLSEHLWQRTAAATSVSPKTNRTQTKKFSAV